MAVTTTKIITITNADQRSLDEGVQEAATVLKGGGVIAVPTDTIYGVAALVSSNEGVERIYGMKGRQKEKPLAICVSDVAHVYKWAKVTVPSDLLSQLLPGPITTVFERQPELNPALNPGVALVGLRIPEHSFVQRLVAECGSPIALTSANVSQARSTLSVEEFRELWPSLDLVIDDGVISNKEDSRQGSTVVDLSRSGKFSIIRPGIYYQQTLSLLRDKYNLTEVIT
jgi:tRNA threonylcarbamoyl adenosine modification protein (Sua5/YciO/YrdC/YwlC family)